MPSSVRKQNKNASEYHQRSVTGSSGPFTPLRYFNNIFYDSVTTSTIIQTQILRHYYLSSPEEEEI